MTVTGLIYDPTQPDPAVLDIDGPEFLATGWATGLEPGVPQCKPGCVLTEYRLGDACACQPLL